MLFWLLHDLEERIPGSGLRNWKFFLLVDTDLLPPREHEPRVASLVFETDCWVLK